MKIKWENVWDSPYIILFISTQYMADIVESHISETNWEAFNAKVKYHLDVSDPGPCCP